MKITYESYPAYYERPVIICDALITEIECAEKYVRFYFSEGFYVVLDKETVVTRSGYIEFFNCDADEFNCRRIKRKSTSQGAIIEGYPMELEKLSSILSEEEIQISIDIELYDYNFVYWRGTVFPYNQEGLSDWVTIETMGQYHISYNW